MRLVGLDTSGIQGVPDGCHAFANRTTLLPFDLVLITGAPAAGKTSLLKAIAAAKHAAGPYPGALFDTAPLLRRGAEQAQIEATWLLSEGERDFTGATRAQQTTAVRFGSGPPRTTMDDGLGRLFSRYAHDPEQGKFEYFPANRRLAGPSWKPPSPSSEAAEGRLRLTRDPDKYAGIRRLFHDLTLADAARLAQLLDTQGVALRTQQPDALAPFKEAIAALLPDLRLTTVDLDERAGRVWFQRRDGVRVELDELSDSEQQAVLFAVTFRRLGLNHSVILIDTPELHLHPCRVAPFFGRLLELGRDNQIIAATTSAELLATVRPEQVIDLGQA